jgi:mono/diheme cytochrome c family protein
MRIATAVAAGLGTAAAVMAVLAFATGGEGDDERAAAPPAATATPTAAGGSGRDGLDVWAEQGCGSCHTFAAANASGVIGPDLDANLDGVPAAYIKESIVAPEKVAAAGYGTGMMPDDYASRIAPDDLDRLVSFLRANAGR